MAEIEAAPGNESAVAAWNGAEGEKWAADAGFFETSGTPHRTRVLEAAGVGGADHVLDVGCGNGRSTLESARQASEGSAVGIDVSSQMLEVARRRAAEERVANVTFVHADA